MGVRITFSLRGHKDDSFNGAHLYSNSCHPDIDAEKVFTELAEGSIGQNDLIRKLLTVTYPSTCLNNKEGDFIFHLDGNPDDYEFAMLVYWDDSGKACFEKCSSFTTFL